MLYLLLAILSSMLITVFMRLSERYRKNPTSMLAMNYLMCSILGILFTGEFQLFPKAEGLGTTLLLGSVCGALFLGSFLLLQWNVSRNGVVLPATFMKLGVLVPTVLSILIFGEKPGELQLIGIAAAVAAILLIQGRGQKEEGGSTAGLVILLLAGGLSDSMSKVYEELGSASLSDHYLLYTFLVALILCVALCIVRKQTLCWQDAIFGLLIGVPNYCSARFLLLSLNSVPAVVAYPSFSVGTIVLVTIAGMVFFGEKLSRRKWAAMAIILAALVLLNL
ncbi:MAG: hypothetical protein E7319_04545 [Clostridiales bacterium]|nr:hypothetical protein [Clostridiales bacterium]